MGLKDPLSEDSLTWLFAEGLSCSAQRPPKGLPETAAGFPRASDPRAKEKPPCLSGSSLSSDLPPLPPSPFRNTPSPSAVREKPTQGRTRFRRLAPTPQPSAPRTLQATPLDQELLHFLALPRRSRGVFTHAVPSAWKSSPSHHNPAKVHSCFKIQIRTFFLENFA